LSFFVLSRNSEVMLPSILHLRFVLFGLRRCEGTDGSLSGGSFYLPCVNAAE